MREFSTIEQLAARADKIAPEARVEVKLLAMAVSKTPRTDKNGKPWAIITIEDVNYTRMEALVFARTFEQYGERIEADKPLMFCGCLQRRKDDASASLIINEIHPVETIFGVFAGGVRIETAEENLTKEKLEKLMTLFDINGKVVTMTVRTAKGPVVKLDFNGSYRMKAGEMSFKAIEEELGFKVAVVPSSVYFPDEDANPRRRWRGSK